MELFFSTSYASIGADEPTADSRNGIGRIDGGRKGLSYLLSSICIRYNLPALISYIERSKQPPLTPASIPYMLVILVVTPPWVLLKLSQLVRNIYGGLGVKEELLGPNGSN